MKLEKFFSKSGMVIIVAVFCTLLWGSAFPCIKTGYEIFQIADGAMGSQMLFAGVRFLIAGFMTILASLFLEREEYRRGKVIKLPIGGILLVALVQTGMQYFFYYIGMAHVTGVKGAILNGSMAFFCVIIARIFYKEKEKLTGRRLAGCLIGLAGVIIVNLGKGELGGGFSLLGEGFMLLSAIVSALGSLVNKEVSGKMGPITLCGWQLTVGSLLLIVLGIGMGGRVEFALGGKAGFLLLLYMAFLSAMAFTLWTILLKYNAMGKVTIFNFLIPVFGTILSALFLGENVFRYDIIVALLMVCAGIYLVNGRE